MFPCTSLLLFICIILHFCFFLRFLFSAAVGRSTSPPPVFAQLSSNVLRWISGVRVFLAGQLPVNGETQHSLCVYVGSL